MKKLKIGNKSDNDVIKIFTLVFNISDKLLVGRNPPDEIEVKAKWNESNSLMPDKLYKNIMIRVEKK